jgi:heat shock protein HslJ
MMLRTAAVLLLPLAAACATTKKEPPPKPFTGTRWEVVLEREPAPQHVPWFTFADGLLEGFAGCSQVTARYVQDTVGAGAIAVGRLNVGRGGACDARAEAVQSHMLEVLQAASSYSIIADLLTMSGSGGTLKLRAAQAGKP